MVKRHRMHREPPGFDEIQHEEQSRLFGRMALARVLVMPFAAIAVIGVVVAEPSPWRRIVIGATAALAAIYITVEHLRFRRHGMMGRTVPMNLTFAVIAPLLVVFATGGLSSPFLYVTVAIGLVCAISLHRRLALALAGIQAAAIWLMALLEIYGVIPDLNLRAFGGGARSGWNDAHIVSNAVLLTAVLLLAQTVGHAVRTMVDGMLRHALEAQQDTLQAHAELPAELAALSGEIAHELKNPLASIKGLSGLLADNVSEGKGAERLAVLRREVERMQEILEEFLNFSRPLVPLSVQTVELGALCEEVAALHEGMARERGVRLEVTGAEATVGGDGRKLKQILLNLVQNAIDASPDGATVTMTVEPTGHGARLQVLDRGRGLDAQLGGRVFEPGVTTKPGGSGLGLTIARAIARQHGGDLTLGPRPGGGCTAELTLPATPPSGPEGAS